MKKKFKIKNIFNKKENIAILVIAVVFCTGIIVNNIKTGTIPLHDGDVLVDSKDVETTEGTNDKGDSFESRRANLDMERNKIISELDDTIKNTDSKAEKKNAIAEKEKIIKYMKQEVEIEGIIDTKNLPATFVLITDSSVNVTIDKQDLQQDMVTKVCNIVMNETGRTADKIVIQSSY